MYERMPQSFYTYGALLGCSMTLVGFAVLARYRVLGKVSRADFTDTLLLQLGYLALFAGIPSPPVFSVVLLPVATGLMGLSIGRGWARRELREPHAEGEATCSEN